MKNLSKRKSVLFLVCAGFFCVARAQHLDTIGVTLLRSVTTNLNGTGVQVGQVESGDGAAANWEINPGVVGQPTNRFTYFYGTSPYTNVITTNTYPNSLGSESGHAELVAGKFYGITNGVATNVAHINNYEANLFINYYVSQANPISERIVNQSFTFGIYNTNVDQAYDNYAAQYNVLFVTGAERNGFPIASSATCYNGIGVNSDAFNSPTGPTPDGRSKPDLMAPGFAETSFTTPQVAGAAAILLQAGLRGDGGNATNSATDIRTMKALLINGAVKHSNWTNSTSSPLHSRYGAGVLNVFNSYEQLAGGKHGYIVSTSLATNSPHPPTGDTGSVNVLSGWDFNTNTSSATTDCVKHYYFNVMNNSNNAAFTATMTLVWNRHKNKTGINNLDLFLYNTANSNLVTCSTSLVDNVEHIYLTNLVQGRYDLQVLKKGGTAVTTNETYALAFEFFSQSLNAARSGTKVALSWPVYPAGFFVESATGLAPPVSWSTNTIPAPVVTNNQNAILMSATNGQQFFRLRRPNF